MAVSVRLIRNNKELDHVMRIRRIVFIRDQDVPHHREVDGLDSSSRHVIAFLGRKPVGCARIRVLSGTAKLERIAVLKSYQGRGIGRAIMNYLISFCKSRNQRMVLHSQCYIKDFYRKHGFNEYGSVFMDAGIQHIAMSRKWSPQVCLSQ